MRSYSSESVLDSGLRAERAMALRTLLQSPLLSAKQDREAFEKVLRHRQWLVEWFSANTGWRIKIDRSAGFARLFKVPTVEDSTHPARLRGKPSFDRRRYALLCLSLAALDDASSQITLHLLADQVVALSREAPEIPPFDPTIGSERRAFVDVLKWLVEYSLLVVRDGDTEGYVRSHSENALFDIDDRLLGQLLASPVPPSLAGAPAGLLAEEYPETEDGRRQRARHRVIRRLLEDPVVYYQDLDADEEAWLQQSRGFIYRLLQDEVGLEVERRKEGILAADPEGTMTDTPFPEGGSTVKHAALLLAEKLAESARSGATDGPREAQSEIPGATVILWMQELIERLGKICGWSQAYLEAPDGADRLAREALEVLVAFHLIRATETGWQPLPAIARFAAEPPNSNSGTKFAMQQEEMKWT